MKRLLLPLLVCIAFSVPAQSVLDYSMDRLPEVYGGNLEFRRFLDYHLVYPEDELRTKTEGKVVIGFMVTKEGKITNAKIIEKASPLLNAEAIRLFNLLQWKPAVQLGQEVDYEYTLAIPFKIAKYKKSLKYRGDDYQALERKRNTPKKTAKHKGEKPVQYAAMPVDSSLVIYEKTDKAAKYYYGNDSLQKFIMANLQYPEMAKRQNIEGTVYLSMVVETNGFVSNLKADKSVGAGCNEEAVRLLGETTWKPAEKDGKLVRSRVIFPVSFRINNTFHDNSFSEQRE